MKTLIKNGYVVNPANNFEGIADILIEDDIITKLEPNITDEYDCVLDAKNLCVMPGLVDMHVHLRDPGFIHKEDIITGCDSAVAGGVTSLLCMPNTKPVIDNIDVVEYIKNKAKFAKAKIYLTGAITNRLAGEKLADILKLKNAGIIAISDDGRPVENTKFMIKALKLAKKAKLVLTSHCEDLTIVDEGIINHGKVSKKLNVKGIHRASEDTITAREIVLAQTNDCPIHIAHVSTKLSTQLIREAKLRGVAVTAETCPHYFSLTEKELLKLDADYRMNPPLREEADKDAILQGIKDGTFDCIVTDHAPHTKEEKKNFHEAPNGVVGMDTSFSASYTYLVKPNHISLSRLVELMSTNPARILNIDAGTLNIGAKADIAIADLNQDWVVEPNKMHSRAKNYVFKDLTLTSKIRYTFVNGKKVFDYKTDKPNHS